MKGLKELISAAEIWVMPCLLAKLSVARMSNSEGKGVAKTEETVAAARATKAKNRDMLLLK